MFLCTSGILVGFTKPISTICLDVVFTQFNYTAISTVDFCCIPFINFVSFKTFTVVHLCSK